VRTSLPDGKALGQFGLACLAQPSCGRSSAACLAQALASLVRLMRVEFDRFLVAPVSEQAAKESQQAHRRLLVAPVRGQTACSMADVRSFSASDIVAMTAELDMRSARSWSRWRRRSHTQNASTTTAPPWMMRVIHSAGGTGQGRHEMLAADRAFISKRVALGRGELSTYRGSADGGEHSLMTPLPGLARLVDIDPAGRTGMQVGHQPGDKLDRARAVTAA
jgi:hypothetical protein